MGFRGFDLQVNGYMGVDFSRPGLTCDAVKKAADALAEAETERFLPTVITSSLDTYRSVLPVLGEVCREDSRTPGIHLEGPFISPENGAVGAHPAGHVQAPSIELFKQMQEWASGCIRLMTLAPERPGALELIEYLTGSGVVVSVGHTLAGARQIADACKAGAQLAAHLGNGIPSRLDRTDNPIWSILASPLTVMLITDGIHVPMDFIRTVYAAKGVDRMILTSDAAPIAGLPAGDYEIFGTKVRMDDQHGIHNLNAPGLAGSGMVLRQCAEICRDRLDLGPSVLEKMCWSNASSIMRS